jgi:hypothetical protein
MKVVINSCFGGFGLSDEAENLYAKKSGFELFRYHQTKYDHRDGETLFEKVVKPEDGGMFSNTLTVDVGDSCVKYPEGSYWYSGNIERTDPILIEVINELGDKADGMCANLEIVDIPDGISWEIEEYDGNEHIAETHRTWS